KGLPAAHLEKSMLDFKSGKRTATIMGRIAKGYSDEEIKAVAKYFADMK
ncbi:MAG TPA: sulfide dehydrogenase, partial [Gammaproteobacteria bacterium]|nr:sulfide dehydrogenase [Gammaproteobacteria bacterium]